MHANTCMRTYYTHSIVLSVESCMSACLQNYSVHCINIHVCTYGMGIYTLPMHHITIHTYTCTRKIIVHGMYSAWRIFICKVIWVSICLFEISSVSTCHSTGADSETEFHHHVVGLWMAQPIYHTHNTQYTMGSLYADTLQSTVVCTHQCLTPHKTLRNISYPWMVVYARV